MKRAWALAAMLLFAVAAWGQAAEKYHSAGVAQAGDIAYPLNTRAPGFVTLDVNVDASGSVQNVTVVRDVPPLTTAALTAVKGWQFTPAKVDGKRAAGVVRLNIAFNPYNPSGVGLPGETLQAPNAAASGDFQPAVLQKANYANYPPNTVSAGTVVLKVRVAKTGKVRNVVAVRGDGALSDAATAAAKTWVYAAATYQGTAIGSEASVVFVFATPEAGTR
jgi:TonB family protein